MTIGIKIGIDTYQHSGGVSYDPLTIAHIARVAQQGGTIDSPVLLNLYVLYLVNNGLMSSQYIGAIPSVTGYKEQAGTGNCAKVFSVDPLGSTSGVYAGDMVQSTLINQPKLLKYSGERYLWSSGIANNWVDCLSSINTQFTDDVEIIMKVNVNLSLGGQQRFFGQYSTGHTIYYTGIDYYGGNIRFYLEQGNIMAITPNWFTDGVDSWLKVTRTASTGNVMFYKSTDGVNWIVQATVTGLTSGTISPSTAGISIGSDSDTGGAGLQGGKVYKATFSKVIEGTPTVNFDFTNYNPAISETTWTSSTGEIWTLNVSPLNTVLHSTIVTKTVLADYADLHLMSGDFNVGTTLNPAAITRFVIKNVQAADSVEGGDIFRSAIAGLKASNFGGAHYKYQVIFTGTDAPTDMLDSSYWGNYPGYGTRASIYPPNKTASIVQRFKKGIVEDLRKNKETLYTASNSGETLTADWLGDLTAGYALGTVAGVWKGHITISGLLSNAQILAFQDFLNTTIFNGEIY